MAEYPFCERGDLHCRDQRCMCEDTAEYRHKFKRASEMKKKRTPTNPKDILAQSRVPMSSLPAIGAVHGAQATGDGIDKGYGPYNWREKPILLSEYLSAMERHLACLKDGEWFTDDSHVTHLGCINANTAIVLDAKECGTLVDDRPATKGGSATELERYKREHRHDIQE